MESLDTYGSVHKFVPVQLVATKTMTDRKICVCVFKA